MEQLLVAFAHAQSAAHPLAAAVGQTEVLLDGHVRRRALQRILIKAADIAGTPVFLFIGHADNIKLSPDGKSVIIIDQTQLPNRMIYLTLDQEKQCYDAIKLLQVRGAPAIGIFAGYSMTALSPAIRWSQADHLVVY